MGLRKIVQNFTKEFLFYNDANNQNMFTLAIERNNKKIINEVMKNLSEMSPEKIVEVTKTISLLDVVNQPNDFIKPLLNHAMVQAISD